MKEPYKQWCGKCWWNHEPEQKFPLPPRPGDPSGDTISIVARRAAPSAPPSRAIASLATVVQSPPLKAAPTSMPSSSGISTGWPVFKAPPPIVHLTLGPTANYTGQSPPPTPSTFATTNAVRTAIVGPKAKPPPWPPGTHPGLVRRPNQTPQSQKPNCQYTDGNMGMGSEQYIWIDTETVHIP